VQGVPCLPTISESSQEIWQHLERHTHEAQIQEGEFEGEGTPVIWIVNVIYETCQCWKINLVVIIFMASKKISPQANDVGAQWGGQEILSI